MNRFAKMKKERIYTLFETLSSIVDDDSVSVRYVLKKMETKKSPEYLLETLFLGGLDGTRTRDPMRDRHVF